MLVLVIFVKPRKLTSWGKPIFFLTNLIHFVSRFAYISCLICREKNQVKNQIWNKEFSKFT